MPNLWWLVVPILLFTPGGPRANQEGLDRSVKIIKRGRVVLDASPDHLISPCVARDNSGFRMWYARTHFFTEDDPLFAEFPWLRGEQHTWFIEHAISSDGITWKNQRRVIGPCMADGIKLTQVHQPSVVREDGGFRMWFNGREKDTGLYRMFHSRSIDGITWEPPSLAMDPGPEGSLHERSVGGCSVIAEDGQYRMWFGGMDAADGKFRTLYAQSSDGLTWSCPALAVDAGHPGDPDARRAYRPCVLRLADGMIMLYCGIADDSLQGPFVTMLATSGDGLNWHKHGTAMDVGQSGAPDEVRCYDAWALPIGDRRLRVWYVGKAADGMRRICHALLEITSEI